MDIQFWIWVAIILLTFLARANKKKKESAPKDSFPDQAGERELNKPMTFEDLLREIQESKEPKRVAPLPVPVTPPRQVEVVDYDDDLEAEEKTLETVSDYKRRDTDIYDVYEKAKKDAFSRQSLEETAKLEDTIVRFGKFKGYQRDRSDNPISQYLKDFQDKEGFKKAFIMSEILNRRF